MAKRGLRKAEPRRGGEGWKRNAGERGAGCRLPTVLPEPGEKQDRREEQGKSFLTQTRVSGHATPSQCLVMQDAEMETVAPQDHGVDAPAQGSPLGASPRRLQGLGPSRVCVHVLEHGQRTDSTSGEAQGRRLRLSDSSTHLPGPPGKRLTSCDGCSGSRSPSLTPLPWGNWNKSTK